MSKFLERVITAPLRRIKHYLARNIYYLLLVWDQSLPESLKGRYASQALIHSIPVLAKQRKGYNYFILQASYGDKWSILSFLSSHLNLYPDSRIIAATYDQRLVEIFVGPDVARKRFIYTDYQTLHFLTTRFRQISRLSLPVADAWFVEGCRLTPTSYLLTHGLPKGNIRHLHFVNYPYFTELFNLHGVGYGILLKTILYLPASTKATQPSFYTDQDHQEALAISKSDNKIGVENLNRLILFNIINFSHESLKLEQISAAISILESSHYRVLINGSQGSDSAKLEALASRHPNASLVTIPATLLALVCNNVDAVVGVLGGAMNVAVQFSKAHILSLQTPAIFTGCSEDELYREWGKENYWKWVDQDWPCMHPGRVVENRFIGDPKLLPDETLASEILGFLAMIQDTATKGEII